MESDKGDSQSAQRDEAEQRGTLPQHHQQQQPPSHTNLPQHYDYYPQPQETYPHEGYGEAARAKQASTSSSTRARARTPPFHPGGDEDDRPDRGKHDSSSPQDKSAATTAGTTTPGSSAPCSASSSPTGPTMPHPASAAVEPSHSHPSVSFSSTEHRIHYRPGGQSSFTSHRTAAASSSAADAAASLPASALPASAPPSSASAIAATGSSSTSVAIKILVSNNASGSIIGRSGKTISDLQNQSACRIKLSQSGDCYPGTSDRVCLIQGSVNNTKKATELILHKVYEVQSQQQLQMQFTQTMVGGAGESDATSGGGGGDRRTSSSPAPAISSSSAFVVRILVPMPCCGMLIGRGGANIKSMKAKSGVSFIQLTPKEHEGTVGADASAAVPSVTSERIMTITGPDLSSCFTCVCLIIEEMSSHPDICRYINMTTSYTRAVSATVQSSAFGTAQSAMSGEAIPSRTLPSYSPPSLRPMQSPLTAPHLFQQQGLYSQPQQSPEQRSSMGIYSPGPLPGPPLMPTSSLGGGQGPPQPQPPQHGFALSSDQMQRFAAPFDGTGGNTSIPSSSPIMLPPAGIGGSPYPGPPSSQQQPQQQSIYVLPPPTSSIGPGTYMQATGQQPLMPQQQDQWPRGDAAAAVGSSNTSRRSSVSSQVGGSPYASASSSSVDNLALHMQRSMAMGDSSSQQLPPSMVQPGQPLQDQPLQQGQQPVSTKMAVPDTLIGSILGRRGKTLTEIQASSNTRIKMSQRGVFVPGTNHRVVTITGPTLQSVAMAQYLINQRMAESAARSPGGRTGEGGTASFDRQDSPQLPLQSPHSAMAPQYSPHQGMSGSQPSSPYQPHGAPQRREQTHMHPPSSAGGGLAQPSRSSGGRKKGVGGSDHHA